MNSCKAGYASAHFDTVSIALMQSCLTELWVLKYKIQTRFKRILAYASQKTKFKLNGAYSNF